MIYLPSPDAVAHEVEASLRDSACLEKVDSLSVVKMVYAAIDRCTTQKVVVVDFVTPPPKEGEAPK
jgi:hypothetical protein